MCLELDTLVGMAQVLVGAAPSLCPSCSRACPYAAHRIPVHIWGKASPRVRGRPARKGLNAGKMPALPRRSVNTYLTVRVHIWGKALPRVRGRPARNGLNTGKMPAHPGEV